MFVQNVDDAQIFFGIICFRQFYPSEDTIFRQVPFNFQHGWENATKHDLNQILINRILLGFSWHTAWGNLLRYPCKGTLF